jgi:predicted RNA-binding protein with PIN domain
MRSFRSIKMHQLIKMMMSIENETADWFLNSVTQRKGSPAQQLDESSSSKAEQRGKLGKGAVKFVRLERHRERSHRMEGLYFFISRCSLYLIYP